MQVDGANNISAGPQFSEMHLVSAYEKTKALWDESNFGGSSTREDLVGKLDAAIGDSGKTVRLDL